MDNADPESEHKIRLQVPQVLGQEITNWAKACLPVVVDADHGDNGGLTTNTSATSVATYGSHTHVVTLTSHVKVPTIGQKVWVMFTAGDPNFPVWMGVQL